MRRICFALLFTAASLPAWAQLPGGGVSPVPPVTANHCVKWVSAWLIGDAGGTCGTGTVPAVPNNDVVIGSGTGIQDSGSLISSFAPLASPAFTGTPIAPTPSTADSSTKIATTAYVQAQGFSTAAGANPTGTIGASAVNGVATTFMRSDAAPALPATLPALNGSNLTNLTAANLTGTTLPSGIVTSSLTTVGTIGTGTWQGTAVGTTYGGLGANNSASTGLPLFAAGVVTMTATTGTGNIARVGGTTFTGTTTFPGTTATTINSSGFLGINVAAASNTPETVAVNTTSGNFIRLDATVGGYGGGVWLINSGATGSSATEFAVRDVTNSVTPFRIAPTTGYITLLQPGNSGAGAEYACISTTFVLQQSTTACLGSDAVMKDNITPLAKSLRVDPRAVVMAMEPDSWIYNDRAGKDLQGASGVGFVAQTSAALEKKFNLPKNTLAHYAKDGHPDNIWDRAYIAYAVAAIQEQERDLISFKNRLSVVEHSHRKQR